MNASTLLSLALALVVSQGAPALKKAMTTPEAWVRKICAKTGANAEEALAERDQAADVFVAFVEDLAGVHTQPEVAAALGLHGVQGATAGAQLPNVEGMIIQVGMTLYKAFGRGFLTHALTVPQAAVHAVCVKTGADEQECLAARTRAADELVDFIESLVDCNFDPAEHQHGG